MDIQGILVLALRGLMAVSILGFITFSLTILWKDMHTKQSPNLEKSDKAEK